MFYGELKIHGELVRFEVLNSPADISVTVEKRGNDEVMAGDEMRYDFSEISNTSNIPLENFFGHLKSELLYLQDFESAQHFKAELIAYLDYYNNRRIKAKLKGLPPALHRLQALSAA